MARKDMRADSDEILKNSNIRMVVRGGSRGAFAKITKIRLR